MRFHALDETALFGCACRHEIPLMFINLKHGERYHTIPSSVLFVSILTIMHQIKFRLGYAVHLLRNVLLHYPDSMNVIMMYDAACTLIKHLLKVFMAVILIIIL